MIPFSDNIEHFLQQCQTAASLSTTELKWIFSPRYLLDSDLLLLPPDVPLRKMYDAEALIDHSPAAAIQTIETIGEVTGVGIVEAYVRGVHSLKEGNSAAARDEFLKMFHHRLGSDAAERIDWEFVFQFLKKYAKLEEKLSKEDPLYKFIKRADLDGGKSWLTLARAWLKSGRYRDAVIALENTLSAPNSEVDPESILKDLRKIHKEIGPSFLKERLELVKT
jgi:tetratricopeptide (TPR) repeat protein